MSTVRETVLILVPVRESVRQRIEHAAEGIRLVYAPTATTNAVFNDVPDCDVARAATVVFGTPHPEWVAQSESLKWLQVHYSGVDPYLVPAIKRRSGFVLTNASGVYGISGAEHILAMMLAFTRGLHVFQRLQMRRKWERELSVVNKLEGKVLGIIGLGDIGTQLARRAGQMGMRTLGIKRTVGANPDYMESLWTLDRLPDLLMASDHVALTLPLTARTAALIGPKELELMKPTAYLYNIGRGALVNESALVRALAAGLIAGAGLDVFHGEPLAPEHPLWRFENVIITPHVGAIGPSDWDNAGMLFAENLRRFRIGAPLRNVVDYRLGY